MNRGQLPARLLPTSREGRPRKNERPHTICRNTPSHIMPPARNHPGPSAEVSQGVRGHIPSPERAHAPPTRLTDPDHQTRGLTRAPRTSKQEREIASAVTTAGPPFFTTRTAARAGTNRARRYLRPMVATLRDPLGRPVSFEYARWIVRQYEGRLGVWRHGLRGGFRCLPYFLPAPAIVVVNAVFARGVLLGVVTGLLALVAGPISGFGWSRRVWERPMLAACAKWTRYDLHATPTYTVNVRQADVDAACAAVRRAKLIPLPMRTHGTVEFNTVLPIARPSFLSPVDGTAQQREVYDLFLRAGIPARDGDHVIGRDPEPSSTND
jgi:hypothetical protein